MIEFLRNVLVHDFWLKLLSLALAILIWLTVWFGRQKGESPVVTLGGGGPGERTYINLPVLVVSPATEVRSFKVLPSQVEVTVRGNTSQLRDLQSKEIRATVDLTGIESASGLHKRIDVNAPSGVIVVKVVPDEVEVMVPQR